MALQIDKETVYGDIANYWAIRKVIIQEHPGGEKYLAFVMHGWVSKEAKDNGKEHIESTTSVLPFSNDIAKLYYGGLKQLEEWIGSTDA